MFKQAKRRTAGRRNFEDVYIAGSAKPADLINTTYKQRQSFYDEPPRLEITVEEFETWAIDRLKVLIEIESCILRGKNVREMESIIKPLLTKYLPLTPQSKDVAQLVNERRKDHYSHYILRLAFCRSEQLRARFIKCESVLFKIRYNLLSLQEQKTFVHSVNLPWEPVEDGEKKEHFDELCKASYAMVKTMHASEGVSVNEEFLNREQFLKVPFEFVVDLVATRSVYLHKGYAYVPQFQQLSLIVSEFSKNLEKELILTMKALPRLDEDDRLFPVLNHLASGYVANEYSPEVMSEGGTDINAQNVASQNVMQHFPLCMSHMMKGLLTNNHLRHTGRQQLSLFLKGIGLGVDEALKFWQNSFVNGGKSGITTEKFNKEYRYNFRHNYGLEGARIKYRPWDCNQILAKSKPGKSEYHGCPYRDFSTDRLAASLNGMGISETHDLTNVMDHVSRGDYQVACTKVFELTHKKQLEAAKTQMETISHPNLYYDRSRQLERAAEVKS